VWPISFSHCVPQYLESFALEPPGWYPHDSAQTETGALLTLQRPLRRAAVARVVVPAQYLNCPFESDGKELTYGASRLARSASEGTNPSEAWNPLTTLMNLASVTKPITAFAIMTEVRRLHIG
jgi:hypothetical protein